MNGAYDSSRRIEKYRDIGSIVAKGVMIALAVVSIVEVFKAASATI